MKQEQNATVHKKMGIGEVHQCQFYSKKLGLYPEDFLKSRQELRCARGLSRILDDLVSFVQIFRFNRYLVSSEAKKFVKQFVYRISFRGILSSVKKKTKSRGPKDLPWVARRLVTDFLWKS